MFRHSQRARIRELQLEQLELESQLQDLTRIQVSPFALRRASELIREWLAFNRHIGHLLRKTLQRDLADGSPSAKSEN